jgi:hypothetical protein
MDAVQRFFIILTFKLSGHPDEPLYIPLRV